MSACPTTCDDDCDAACHEPHDIRGKWAHDPDECVRRQSDD